MKRTRVEAACGGFFLGIGGAVFIMALLGEDPSRHSIELILYNGLLISAVCALLPRRFLDKE